MNLIFAGLILIAFGGFYIKKPTIYRRGIWLKTSLAIRFLSEEGYKRYIKGIGVVYILIGCGLIIWSVSAKFFALHI